MPKLRGDWTPLMAAALTGQAETVRILLQAGADPKVKDMTGKNAADIAESKGHSTIVAMLKKAGAGPTPRRS